jgi:hypothetical protein
MAGIFQADVFIKLAIELGIEDMRKNPWLIEHMLQDLKTNRYVREKIGQKQIDAHKEFLENNQIDIYMKPRDDRDRLPNITIELGPAHEKVEMKTMGDESTNSVILLPNEIGRPIPFIIKPFIPSGYDQASGVVMVSDSVDISLVEPGMILVNPETGCGWVIQGLVGGLQILPGQIIDASQLAVVPHYQYYKAREKHTFIDEAYNISANAHGDPQNVIFLWNFALYSILRYRESLLEANGLAESKVSFGGVSQETAWTTPGGEKAYTRLFTLEGQSEPTWLAAPARIIESVSFSPKLKCKGLVGGITIASNANTPGFYTNQSWETVNDPFNDDSEDQE